MIEIDATLDGDSSVAADATVAYDATSTMAGSSSETAGPTVAITASSTMAGSSSETDSPTASLSATATMDGSSIETAGPTVALAASATMDGSSSETDGPTVFLAATATMAGSSDQSAADVLQKFASVTMAGSSSETPAPTMSLAGAATASASSSVSDSPTAAYAATATSSGSSSLSGVLADNAAVTMSGSSTMSSGVSDLIDMVAAGASTVTVSAIVKVAVSATMAGSSAQDADQNRIDAHPQGTAAVTSSANVEYGADSLFFSVSTLTASVDRTVGATATMAGSSAMAASALPVALTATMAGSSGMGVANPIALVTASMHGAAAVAANPKVVKNVLANMAGASALTASPNYVRIDITATFSGGSDMSADPLTLGQWGEDGYGNSPYGGAHPPYGLLSAEALSQTLVRVRYTAMFDTSFPDLLALFNYSISPSVTIHSISIESAQSVLLNTDPLTGPLYTVTIEDARGYFGQPLNPYLTSQSFFGVPATPTFFAVATRKTRVRAVFSNVMLQNSSLTDPSQYQLTDLNGTSIPILSVETEQVSDVRSTVLLLGADLVDERHYQVTTLPGIVTADLEGLNPNTSVFQWVENVLRTQVPVVDFSGEVQNGLYGIHGGLVFFSPALQNSASNSIIQVEEVDVCTRAFDEYHPPQPIDPPVLSTYGLSSWTPAQWAGVDPIPYVPPVTTLNSDAALWAAFPRLLDAKFELTMPAPAPGGPDTLTTDHVSPAQDSICDITLSETWDLTRVSLLNVTSWRLFDNDTPYTAGAASIAAAAPGFFTLTGLAGMTALSVGGFLTLSGADNAGNNGTFRITAFISAASVEIANPFGVAPDANNGSITWTKPPAFILASNLTPIPPGNTTSRTYLEIFMDGEADATGSANALLASQATMAGSSSATASGTVL
jgi:hypothetical protein